jgi:thiamine biosynthesis lipoprotein
MTATAVTALASVDGQAFGTLLRVVVSQPELLGAARKAVDRVVRKIDQCCSRFRADSELSALNASAGHEVTVSPLMTRALSAALRGARLSGGAVDPTVCAAVKAAGYSVDFAEMSPDLEPFNVTVAPVPGWQRIRFSEATRRLMLPAGVELDLGSTAKALAADLAAAEALDAMGHGGVLVNLGGDIAVAGEAPAEGWHIQLADDSHAPFSPDHETICIRSGGVATSSTTVRRWTRGGVEMHHIIDPRSGVPAAGPWRTATVSAGDCLDANIAATAAIVLGYDALDWIRSVALPARLVDGDGEVTRTAGWPRPAP